ncbi:MAG: 4Fe-4S binding protein [Candidimonas sp.]|nr:MAG: 4Fe-4S binding protein [Candidimonas sp.]TAM23536.1 MAG: 4Fe-4S binding protein [Candidimonas sp.]TAM73924.1 MAG: 4Fe-4S binding protein [Candidimonas sp.]
MAMVLRRVTTKFADTLRDHAPLLRKVQWAIVAVYLFLLIVPAVLPLPGRSASIFNNLTIFAQFAFWGVWWPFVLVSMPLVGRAWCGLFCPEGMLTEWASEHGRGRAIPKWMRWGGWPFVAFTLTTVYGQLVSVYQYPWAVLAVLGGSTAGAIVVGWLYGRNKRVWCKYLCPVNGVFNLLAKLAPWHYKVDEDAWRNPVRRTASINCAPLVPLRHMKGSGDCHMCGRCSDYRGAIALTPRSPETEIVDIATGDNWQTALIVFGLMGLAVGAFLWSASPWFVTIKQASATWLVDHNIYWPLAQNAPWFILTHYPDVNDSFTWLDGAGILVFIMGAAVCVGGPIYMALWLADRLLPVAGKAVSPRAAARRTRFGLGRDSLHKLAQGLIPAGGAGVFLGLSATTLTLLKHEGVPIGWAAAVRFTLLGLALLWSLRLVWRLTGLRSSRFWLRAWATMIVALGLVPFCASWVLFFVVW